MISKELLKFLRCPDDLAELKRQGAHLQCTCCKRKFNILSENSIELLPRIAYYLSMPEQYREMYYSLLKTEFNWNESAKGWGDLEMLVPGFKEYVKQLNRTVREMLRSNLRGAICDISGGAGNYSLPLSEKAQLAFHLDLDPNSINSAYFKSKTKPKKNTVFLRADYLQLPFANECLDGIVCLGHTLSHGFNHEHRVICEIVRCLKTSGTAIVDFSNYGRLWRLSSLKKSSASTYTRSQLAKLLSDFSSISYNVIGNGYVPGSLALNEKVFKLLDRMFKMCFFPPSTWVVRIKKRSSL